MLTKELIKTEERNRFIGLVENLSTLTPKEEEINVQVAELSNKI